jgi:hypothetical protein
MQIDQQDFAYTVTLPDRVLVVTAHAIKRFRERVVQPIAPGHARVMKERTIVKHIVQAMADSTRDNLSQVLAPWLGVFTAHDSRGRPLHLALCERNRAVLVYREEPKRRVVVTCFKAVCKSCQHVHRPHEPCIEHRRGRPGY